MFDRPGRRPLTPPSWSRSADAGFTCRRTAESVPKGGKGLVVSEHNAERLLYRDGGATSTRSPRTCRHGSGKATSTYPASSSTEDRFQPENVTIRFGGPSMIVRAHNLPNHPTAKFPSPPGSGDRNPSYIQEHDYTYSIPLDPEPDPGSPCDGPQ